MKVDITIYDIRLKSNLTTFKTIKFTKKIYIIHTFTQPHSCELGDNDGFVQLVPTTYRNDRLVIITGSDKSHLKSDCIQGSIVNGTREPILYSFALSSPPGHKIYKEPRINFF